MSETKRLIAAILIVLGIGALLNPYSPRLDAELSNFDQVALWAQINSAIRYFFAVAVGAVVARRNFIGPAVLIAVVMWGIVTYILYDIARAATDISFAKVAADGITGLILMIIAAISGALIGKWFYQHELAQCTSAT
ncbi:MAG: hypothetical protein OER97_05870 [Gammaproteobacteria bacterium]|nr:hypothetical protein [Gammaproteobacteria bacterium]